MAHPQAVNVLNKQSRGNRQEPSSKLGVGPGANSPLQ